MNSFLGGRCRQKIAVERTPAQPDYSGLDVVSGAAIQSDGRASTAKFTEWVTSRLKERAQVWKQERLYNQESRNLRGKGSGGKGGGDDSDDDEAGKTKKKKKSKGGGKGDPPVAT